MATPLLQPGQLVALDADGLIAADLPCRGCGYLLRKRAPDGTCPECGKAVAETLNASNVRLLNQHWLRQLQTGAILLSIACPALLLFGIGALVWFFGALAMMVDVPKQPRTYKRLQVVIVISGIAAGVSLLAMIGTMDTGSTEVPILVALGVLLLSIGIHVGSTIRLAAVFCGEAEWKGMHRMGSVLAWYAWCWPFLIGGGIVVAGVSFSYAWGGQGPPPIWLNAAATVIWALAGIGSLVFLLALFFFWIGLAIRLKRIRQEAREIYKERQLAASA